MMNAIDDLLPLYALHSVGIHSFINYMVWVGLVRVVSCQVYHSPVSQVSLVWKGAVASIQHRGDWGECGLVQYVCFLGSKILPWLAVFSRFGMVIQLY